MKISGIAGALAISTTAFLAFASGVSATTITDSVSSGVDGNDFKRYTSDLFKPRDGAVTISGTVDFSNAIDGDAILIGLVDAGLYNNSGNPTFATYQSGAYAYFNVGASNVAAATDGNAGGGEILQERVDGDGADLFNFSLTIFPDGLLNLTANGKTTSNTYGDVKIRPDFDPAYGTSYAYDEFANGAYLAVDFAADKNNEGDRSVSYNFDATPVAASAVPEPSSILLMGSGFAMFLLSGFGRRKSS